MAFWLSGTYLAACCLDQRSGYPTSGTVSVGGMVAYRSRCLVGHPGQLSHAIPPRVGEMSASEN